MSLRPFPFKSAIRNYMIVATLCAIVCIVIVFKAAYIMFGERDKWEKIAQTCVIDSVTLKVSRGDIVAADGQLLATYVPEYKIYVDYNIYEKDSVKRMKLLAKKDSLFFCKLDSLSQGLARLLPDKSEKWFRDRLMEGYKRRSHNWLIYPRRISYLDFKEVKKLPYFNASKYLSGFKGEEYNKIDKPFGSLAARTLGDVEGSSGRGISGLQLRFDSLLAGKPGLGHKVKTMNKYITVVDRMPVEGADVHTTLDVNMQDFCENALVSKLKEIDGMYGVAMLMEVKTGDIKAITNMVKGNDGEYHDIQNLAVSQLMQPGSVFKTVSITAAMESGKVKITDRVDCSTGSVTVGGYNIRDASSRSRKVISVPEVLGYSSNVGVIKLITGAFGQNKQTEQEFCDDVVKLGIAEDLQLDLPGYQRARIPSPRSMGEYWSASSMASMSIGYSTMVPPISLLAFYNGLANGGRMMRPRIVTHITRNGEVIMDIPPRAIKERMCSPSTVRDITTCLRWVVSDGLGGKAGSPYFTVAGKTGTARVQEKDHYGEYLITFVGFFPVENPKYTCIVCMRKKGSGSGGGMCGPVFKQIAEYAMAQGKQTTIRDNVDSLHAIPPVLDFTNLLYANRALSDLNYIIPGNQAIQPSHRYTYGSIDVRNRHVSNTVMKEHVNRVPDLTGMGPRDALYMLEKMHLSVSLQGVGKVVGQSLPAGHVVKPGEKIVLSLGTRAGKKKEEPHAKPDSTATAPAARHNGDTLPRPHSNDSNKQKTP